MHGKIIKGIAGFYYVYTEEYGLLECKAKGIFRREKKKPLPGDDVDVVLLHEEDREGSITEILPRKNALVRPAVANVDQALVIFAARRPKPNFNLLDRFLIMMEVQQVPAVICFNKADLTDEEEKKALYEIYRASGYPVLFVSALQRQGIDQLAALLQKKTTVVAGPSGVGKSSLVNLLQKDTRMETGDISAKIQRGKHTTRHSQLLPAGGGTFLMDTPGFSSLMAPPIKEEELKEQFPEFADYEPACRFQGCMHLKEPECAVKEAVDAGKISPVRYDNYRLVLEELKNRKKY